MTNTTATAPVGMHATTQLDPPMYALCNGRNHSDSADLVTHDRCGTQVARGKDSRLFTIMHVGMYQARSYFCFSQHECDEASVAAVAVRNAARVADGEIVKGRRAIVFKGRKLPVGLTGEVVWLGIDNYSKGRAGIRADDGMTHFTATSNLRPIPAGEAA